MSLWDRYVEGHRRLLAIFGAEPKTINELKKDITDSIAAVREAVSTSTRTGPPSAVAISSEAPQYNDVYHEMNSIRIAFKKGENTHEQYVRRLTEMLADADFDLAEARDHKKYKVIAADEYSDIAEEIRERKADIRDRLKDAAAMVDWDATEAKDSRWTEGQKGKWARFDYVDEAGSKSSRNVTMWESRGRYVSAYCRDRKAERTFRKVRISDWQAG